MAPDRLVQEFRESVVEPFSVQHAGTAGALDYAGYLSLGAGERTGDEANIVDNRFTRAVLAWLGWSDGDFAYNSPEPGCGKHVQHPDFRVKSMGVTVSVVEDKASTLDFDPSMLEQMRRYAEGSTAYALWTNARQLRLERFRAGGPTRPSPCARSRASSDLLASWTAAPRRPPCYRSTRSWVSSDSRTSPDSWIRPAPTVIGSPWRARRRSRSS